MKISDFRTLSPTAQFDILFGRACLMSRRSHETKTVVIYSLGNFFVKMSLGKSDNEVLEIVACAAGDLPLKFHHLMSADNPLMYAALGFSDLLLEMSGGWAPSFGNFLEAA